jgi:hypothetical protein
VEYRELTADAVTLAGNEQGRHFLSYLVGCALPDTLGAYAVIEGQRYEFPGDLGLAPHWLDRPLTETEQRWLTAGILARTNFFGKKVVISMRCPNGSFKSLEVASEEAKGFTLYEGDFFGNLFGETSVACVAAAPRTPEQAADPIFALRVGTEIDKAAPPYLGKPLTRCGFVLTGSTDAPQAHFFNGVQYDEYISVYLQPQKS